MIDWRHRLATFVRSLAAGGAATLVDLVVLWSAIHLGVEPRAASVPALLAGAIVQFVGNRRFAFRSKGAIGRQATLFAITEAIALGLNAIAFDLVARAFPLGAWSALVARAVTTNAVFLVWSYPVWSRIFRDRSERARALAG